MANGPSAFFFAPAAHAKKQEKGLFPFISAEHVPSVEDARNLVETATLAGAVIGSGKPF
jgi:hypothetical protein